MDFLEAYYLVSKHLRILQISSVIDFLFYSTVLENICFVSLIILHVLRLVYGPKYGLSLCAVSTLK